MVPWGDGQAGALPHNHRGSRLVMRKAFRQAQVLKLVRGDSISTQEELAEKLAAAGIDASQVTLSRDIRELGLIKTAAGYHEQNSSGPQHSSDNLRRVLQEFLRDLRVAQNLVILRDRPRRRAARGAGAR